MLQFVWTQFGLNLPLIRPTIAEQSAQQIENIISHLKNALNKETKVAIMDLCSGSGGGPCVAIQDRLNTGEHAKENISIYLSDLYPSVDTWKLLSSKHKNLKFVDKSVNAMNIPKDWDPLFFFFEKVLKEFESTGVNNSGDEDSDEDEQVCVIRTMFGCLHHFNSEQLSQILKDTMIQGHCFMAVDLVRFDEKPDHCLQDLGGLLFWGVSVLLGSPFIFLLTVFKLRPFRPLWLCFFWLLLWVAYFDSNVSWARAHPFREVLKLAYQQCGQQNVLYRWQHTYLQVPFGRRFPAVVCYVGVPVTFKNLL
ncbi:hypothetical protein RFI_10766 [Reticulomyxa filosa]|uniref:Uncharacterized protein n=1 Tax=Reticulomyxa filosa TaxID=46433 RepID=X6NJA5_RETFI|nr:hypothetical protein RFI_10766 [Reticulomyxa filosa]|eukprot:ETO26370.1 hypothetical protein RFI_10766 [Reticulomyxa filosa]